MQANDLPLPPELAVEAEPFDLALLDAHVADVVLLGAEASPAPEPVQRWFVASIEDADWAMRILAGSEVQAEGVRMQAEAWRHRIAQWEAAELRPLETRSAYFRAHLEDYALRRREDDPKAKTLRLPSGEVGTRGSSPKVVITDEDAVIAWAKANATEVLTYKVMVSDLRKVATVADVIDQACITLSCGDVLGYYRDGNDAEAHNRRAALMDTFGAVSAMPNLLGLGNATRCTICKQDALVGKVEPMSTHPEAHDAKGALVPGTAVEEGPTTAKVVPYG